MPVTQLSINVTDKCNLNCSYCFNRPRHPRDMSISTAKKAVDFLITQAGDSPYVNLGFFGGEPLLRFQTIKEVVAYGREKAKSTGKEIVFGITTNGTLLNQDIFDFFMENNVFILLSLDGIPQITKNAVSGQKIKIAGTNLEEYVQEMADQFADRAAVRVTIIPETAQYIFDIFKYFAERNFTTIGIVPALNVFWPDGTLHLFEEQMTLAVEYWLETLEDLNINFQPVGYYVAKLRGKLDIPSLHMHYCSTQRLGIAADGTIFPCHRFASFPEKRKYSLGHLETGFDSEAYERYLNERRQLLEECSYGCCPAANYLHSGTVTEQNPTASIMGAILDKVTSEAVFKFLSA